MPSAARDLANLIAWRFHMPRRVSIVIAGSLLVLAACGGSAGASQPAAPSGSGASAAPAATDAGSVPTDQPGATAEPGATSGGGGIAGGDACKLLTVDEVMQATGSSNVAAGAIPLANMTDALAGCSFVSGGQIPVLNVILLDPQNTNSNPDDMKLLPGTEEVHVNGARAMWAPAAGQVLFVYKGSKVVMLQVFMPLNDDIKATASSLAQKVADRM